MLGVDPIKLSQIICTRISHDLIGNIGAVSNAVELLEEGDTDFIEEIKNILKISSEVLGSRLKFFRMAYGLDNSNIENKNIMEKVSRDYVNTIGNSKENPIIINFEQERFEHYGRIIMLGIMVCVDIMIKGGLISVGKQNEKLRISMKSSKGVSIEKIRKLQEICIEEKLPTDLAQYAAIILMKEIIEKEKMQIEIAVHENFELIIG